MFIFRLLVYDTNECVKNSCFPRQAEQRKYEEDEQRKQDNELAFKAWLMKKREQFQEEKRIRRAQEMERMHSKV